jgi:seryl-tRNA synthetase
MAGSNLAVTDRTNGAAMHDIRAIRADPTAFDAALARRKLAPVSSELLAKDAERRAALTALQEKQARRNALAREVGQGKRTGADTSALEAEAAALRADTEGLEKQAAVLDEAIKSILESLPNTLDPEIPDGPDESANVVLFQHGEPRDLGFQPKQHFELGEALGLMDFATAAKLAGARFVVLRGALARLERALGQFMIDLHTREHGYTEMVVPSLVNDATLYGTGQLPKFAEDNFRTTDGRWLIPTAEVPLTNTVAGDIVAEKSLPLRMTALTDCYRSEAGASGRDTRGMLRQHQFRKVEMVSITHPDQSADEHERMTRCAEKVLTLLEVPFRRVVLSSGDTGFSAAKTYDLEVWLPGQQTWREISSCSNCRDFQARRMNARFRSADGKTVAHVHTLNGSGTAVGRALIGVMENHQQADGSILIPEVLWPYMGGNSGSVQRIAPQ